MSATDLLRDWYQIHAELSAAENAKSGANSSGDHGSSRMASTRSLATGFLGRRAHQASSPRSLDASARGGGGGGAGRSSSASPSVMVSPINTARRVGASGTEERPPRSQTSCSTAVDENTTAPATGTVEASLLTYAPLALKEKDLNNTSCRSEQNGDSLGRTTSPNNFKHRPGTPSRSEASHVASLRVKEAVANERRAKAEERLWLDAQLEVRKQREEELEFSRQERKHATRLLKLLQKDRGSFGSASAGSPMSRSNKRVVSSSSIPGNNKQQIIGALRPFGVLPVERCDPTSKHEEEL